MVDGKIETVPYTTQTGRTLEVIDGEIDFEFDSKILVPVVVELSSGFLEVETIYWDYGLTVNPLLTELEKTYVTVKIVDTPLEIRNAFVAKGGRVIKSPEVFEKGDERNSAIDNRKFIRLNGYSIDVDPGTNISLEPGDVLTMNIVVPPTIFVEKNTEI